MKIKSIICIFISAVILFTVMPFCVNAQETEAEYIPGEAVFSYTQTLGSDGEFLTTGEVNEELSSVGILRVKELPYDEIYDTSVKENKDGTKTKTGWFTGYFDGDTAEMCQKLNALSSVDEATPNYLFTQDEISIPSEITSPTNLYTKYTEWWFDDLLNIPAAWSEFDTMGEGVVVAVLDAGFAIDNPEFTGRVWQDAAGNRGFNAVTYTNDVAPDTAHGTNVASIIVGAAGYNGSVIGVAPYAQIMPIKVSSSPSSITIDAVVAGINYAVKNNADILSMSLSTTSNLSLLQTACRRAYDSGIIVLASAGNANTTVKYYPAAYDFIIGIMASGPDGKLCYFSNYDPTLEYYNIAAPGYQILGAFNDSTTVNAATVVSGTSQATPIVAGLAALYLSVYPDHTNDEFCRALFNSSTDTVKSYYTDHNIPIVNAMKLLSYPAAIPSIFALVGTTAVVDDNLNFIYGLDESYSSIEDYVGVNDGSYEIIPTENGNGTGTIIRLYAISGEIYADYEIIIFGDTDGDARCDGRDTLLCDYAAAGGSVPDSIAFASDVDFDDDVDSDDSGIIARCGVFTDYVSQIR